VIQIIIEKMLSLQHRIFGFCSKDFGKIRENDVSINHPEVHPLSQ